jgi:hypothetical protein
MAFKKKEDEAIVAAEQGTVVFELLDKNDQTHKIVSTDLVFDEKEQRIRKIMLSIGAKTIFVDEMEEFEHELPLVSLTFRDRKLEIDGKDKNSLEFLRLTDQNVDKRDRLAHKKPALFREIRPLQDIKAKRAKLELMNKAETLAATCKEEEMLPFAHVLGIDTQEDSEFVRVNFIEVARINPGYFIKYFSNPKNDRQFLVGKALRQVLIIVDGGIAKFVAGDKTIVEVPADENPESFLADFCATESGKAFHEALKKLVG